MNRRCFVSFTLLLISSASCTRSVDRSDGKIPLLGARRVEAGTIKVDGKMSEAAWRRAGATGPFVHPGSGKEVSSSPVRARGWILWSEERLLAAMVIKDRAPESPFSRKDVDPHIWARASGVELMIQPGDPGDNTHYYEVQVDVAGALWDTRFDDYNRPISSGPAGKRYGHQQWRSGLERAIAIDAAAGHYTVELALPWKSLTSGRTGVPPAPGDIWRLNMYSFRDGQRAALAWSPILRRGNFHRAARFGRVRFDKP